MNTKSALVQRVGKSLKKAAPTILTCVSAAGVVATAVLTAKATPKALMCLEEAKTVKNDEKLSKIETIEACWMTYVPAAIAGIATIGCILGANVLNKRQQASLIGAYAFASKSYNEYKQKVKEICGEEARRKVMAALAADKSDKTPISAGSIVGMTSLEFEDADEEERLFYDGIGERYFQATISQVLQAEYHLNRNLVLGYGFVTLNNFYEFLGIPATKEGDDIGWMLSDEMYWIDFNHRKVPIDDGLNGEFECYIIEAPFPPMTESEYEQYFQYN